MTPFTHPLPDGRYKAIYLFQGRGLAEGDLLISHGVWMLVQEWWVLQDEVEAPSKWIEVPLQAIYQKETIDGKEHVVLNDPIPIPTLNVKRAIFPSPQKPPQS